MGLTRAWWVLALSLVASCSLFNVPQAVECDPVGNAGCKVDYECRVIGLHPHIAACDVVSTTFGNTPIGSPCSGVDECKANAFCVAGGGVARCRQLCRIDAPATCKAPETCQTLEGETPVFGTCCSPMGCN